MLKLLHTADLHIGQTFSNRDYPDEVRLQLVEGRFECLERMVALAEEEQCRLMIVAGDLFHRVIVSTAQVSRAVNILKRFSGVVALLPGNHDYYEAHGQLWPLLKELASDDFVLLTEERPYSLLDHGIEAVLYPALCDSKHSAENRLGWISALSDRPPAKWHIGVAHGTVRGISPDFNDQYFPMEESELAACALDHWCMGHTHVPYPDLKETGSRPFIYCGTPEPDGFDCRHSGSAWVTELDDEGGQHSRTLNTGQFRFVELEKQVQNSADLESLCHEFKGEEKLKTLVKLKLSGTLSEADYIERISFLNRIRDTLLYLERDDSELTMEMNLAVINSKYPEGSFPQLLLTRLTETENREALQMAYRMIEEVKK